MAAPLVTALTVAALALAGCSGSSGSAATPTAPAASASTQPPTVSSPTPDAAAVRALASAARVMRAVRSYRFEVRERLVAGATQESHLVGAVVRGQGLTYRLTVGTRTTQVVRLRAATYVRVVPHRWSRLRHARRLADPAASLLQVLQALVPTGVGRADHITAIHGELPVAAARSAGLPASRPAEVTVTIDGRGRVIALDLSTTTQAAGRDVTVRVRTSYSDFGHVARIRKPV